MGGWDWSARLHTETLTWVDPDTRSAAIAYHQLGMLAEARGDYAAAEDWYRRSLTIRERLGDQAGTATSYGQLGLLYVQLGRVEEAVPFTLAALAFFAQAGSPNTALCVRSLTEQRRSLGDDRFTAILTNHLDPDSVQTILNATAATPGDPST